MRKEKVKKAGLHWAVAVVIAIVILVAVRAAYSILKTEVLLPWAEQLVSANTLSVEAVNYILYALFLVPYLIPVIVWILLTKKRYQSGWIWNIATIIVPTALSVYNRSVWFTSMLAVFKTNYIVKLSAMVLSECDSDLERALILKAWPDADSIPYTNNALCGISWLLPIVVFLIVGLVLFVNYEKRMRVSKPSESQPAADAAPEQPDAET